MRTRLVPVDIEGKTVFITGGGSGIGLALTKAFVAAGNEVIICGRTTAKLERAAAEVAGIHTIRCDISDPDDVDRCLAKLETDFPALDVLVNNAGVFHLSPFADNDDAVDNATDEMMVNYVATVRLIKRLLPRLRARPESAIVNVTSALAYLPFAAAPTYCASKAALHAFTLSLRHQLADTPVSVFEVLPPLVDTDMVRTIDTIPKISADEVAEQTLRGLARNRYEHPIGIAKMIRRLSRFAPGTGFKMLNRSPKR